MASGNAYKDYQRTMDIRNLGIIELLFKMRRYDSICFDLQFSILNVMLFKYITSTQDGNGKIPKGRLLAGQMDV